MTDVTEGTWAEDGQRRRRGVDEGNEMKGGAGQDGRGRVRWPWVRKPKRARLGKTWPEVQVPRKTKTLGRRGCELVPWKRDGLPQSRSAAPGWQGATSELIGHE